MILTSVLLALVGSADLIRSSSLRERRRALIVALTMVAWVVVLLLAVIGLGMPLRTAVIPIVIAVVWLATTSEIFNARGTAGILPTIGVLVVVLAFLAWDRSAGNCMDF